MEPAAAAGAPDGYSKIDEALEMKALRRVIGAFLNYPSAAEDDVRRWERSFSKLSSKQKELLPHLVQKYSRTRSCIEANFQLVLDMLRNFDSPLDFEEPDLDGAEYNKCSNGRLQDASSCSDLLTQRTEGKAVENGGCGLHGSSGSKRLPVEADAVGVQSADPTSERRLEEFAHDQVDWFQPLFHMHVPPSDVDKVRCVLRNIVRDWTEEGSLERERCYKPILEELRHVFPSAGKTRHPSCLVPGAGLGRLCLEISRLGFVCQGNEFSYYMLICSSFILNSTLEPLQYTVYPWIHSNCNKLTDHDQLDAVRFPDIHPGSAGITEGFSMCAGDFVEVYAHPNQKGAWDAVVTCFFMDTAHNIVTYIEIISKILKPGGVWINLGPLLYHFADAFSCSPEDEMSIELSLEDVKQVALHYGFKIKKEATIQSTYTACSKSMMQNNYYSAFWTMVKEQ